MPARAASSTVSLDALVEASPEFAGNHRDSRDARDESQLAYFREVAAARKAAANSWRRRGTAAATAVVRAQLGGGAHAALAARRASILEHAPKQPQAKK